MLQDVTLMSKLGALPVKSAQNTPTQIVVGSHPGKYIVSNIQVATLSQDDSST